MVRDCYRYKIGCVRCGREFPAKRCTSQTCSAACRKQKQRHGAKFVRTIRDMHWTASLAVARAQCE